MKKINIVKICNFPINENTSIEIEQSFSISSDNQTLDNIICCPKLVELDINDDIVSEYLFCIDDEGNNVTLFRVSFAFYKNENKNKYFSISQNGFIHGKHIESITAINIDNFSTLFQEKIQFVSLQQSGSLSFSTSENLRLACEFLTKEEDNKDEIKFNNFLNDNPPKKVVLSFKIESDTKIALSKMQQTLDYWRELFFLIYGFFPAYYETEIIYDEKLLLYCHYNRRFPQKSTFFKKIKYLPHETFD